MKKAKRKWKKKNHEDKMEREATGKKETVRHRRREEMRKRGQEKCLRG